MTEKILTSPVIESQPLPGQELESSFNISQNTSNNTFSTQKINDQNFNRQKIAHELLGSALNTRSKKILQEFEFAMSGAIQIGKYESGVSGDVKISPSGIVARNKSGLISFALDGDTGDAIFRGTVQAGSLISASDIIGGSININDVFYVDENGNVEATSINITGGTININDAFTVDINGNVVATSATFGQYISKAGTSQAFTGNMNVGASNVKIDGANKRIIINDGSNDRILIGYQENGF